MHSLVSQEACGRGVIDLGLERHVMGACCWHTDSGQMEWFVE